MSDVYDIRLEFSDVQVIAQVTVDGDVLIFQGGYPTIWEAASEARQAIERDRDMVSA